MVTTWRDYARSEQRLDATVLLFHLRLAPVRQGAALPCNLSCGTVE